MPIILNSAMKELMEKLVVQKAVRAATKEEQERIDSIIEQPYRNNEPKKDYDNRVHIGRIPLITLPELPPLPVFEIPEISSIPEILPEEGRNKQENKTASQQLIEILDALKKSSEAREKKQKEGEISIDYQGIYY